MRQHIAGGGAAEVAIVILVTAIWGSAFSVTKYALGSFTPWQLIVARFVPTIPLYAVICWKARPAFGLLSKTDWIKLAVAGLCGTVAYNLALNTGQTHVGAGVASLVIALNPPTILMLAVSLRGESVPRTLPIGMGIAFMGVALLTLSRHGLGIDRATLSGVAFILLCPLTWGIYTVLIADLVPKLGVYGAPAASVLVGNVVLLPTLPVAFADGVPTGWVPWLCALSLALLSTIVAFTMWAWLLKRRGAARTGVVVYLNVLWGLLVAKLALSEELSWQMLAGACVILLGVAIARRRPSPESSAGSPTSSSRTTVHPELVPRSIRDRIAREAAPEQDRL